jgi:hypothetical protein
MKKMLIEILAVIAARIAAKRNTSDSEKSSHKK